MGVGHGYSDADGRGKAICFCNMIEKRDLTTFIYHSHEYLSEDRDV